MSPLAVVAGDETTLVVKGRSLTNDGIRLNNLAIFFKGSFCFVFGTK